MNIPDHILEKIGKNLYMLERHPIGIIKNKVFEYFTDFEHLQISDPHVSVDDNFDSLLIPANHPSRLKSDTYYVDESHVLRTHMTAYLTTLAANHQKYLICGDVYRKDAIDYSHYPVFHQIDGFKICDDPEEDLKTTLSGLVKHLFGQDCKYRFSEDYFPFTTNSIEIEVEWNGKQIEVLGGGVVHPKIMETLGLGDKKAWAFGIGIERLAMLFFKIPDIRLFWTSDSRFLKQFNNGYVEFKPYSKYPPCVKDITFWLSETFSYNDMCDIIRSETEEDIIESVELIDEYKTEKTSHCYRITYRHNSRSLTNEEINLTQTRIREKLVLKLKVILR
jgi:phenylalanyl-tRNA synthetase alpha chain